MGGDSPVRASAEGDRLESWKSIASYLNRDVRTVQRWEKREGLPIYRDAEGAVAAVYAYRSEIDAWWAKRFRRAGEQVRAAAKPKSRLRICALVAGVLTVLAIGIAWRLRTTRVPRASQITLRRVLSGLQGSEGYGAVSRDGRYLSVGMRRVGLRDLMSGEVRHLTSQTEFAEATYSCPSPDAKQVAYTWPEPDGSTEQLRLVGLEGGRPRVLYSGTDVKALRPLEWPEERDWILTLITLRGGARQIVLISSKDGSKRVLKSTPAPVERASLSPDGRYVVYDRPDLPNAREFGVYLFPVGPSENQSSEWALAPHPAQDRLWGWAPKGDRVLFTSDRSGTTDLWMIPVLDGKAVGEPELVRREAKTFHPMGFTREGALFYTDRGQGTAGLHLAAIDVATGKLLSPPAPLVEQFPGATHAGDWSPDGRHIAYLAERPDRRVVIRAIESGEERLLPRIETTNWGLRWSPDGRSLLLLGQDPTGGAAGIAVNVTTGDFRTLAATGKPLWPLPPKELENLNWTGDSRGIFHLRARGAARLSEIVRRDFEGGEQVLHSLSFPAVHRELAVSPDGRHIAFFVQSRPEIPPALMAMPASGKAAKEVWRATDRHAPAALVWSRDGGHLLFSAREAEESKPDGRRWHRLWKVALDGGAAQPTELRFRDMNDVRVHPDGRRIAFRSGGARIELWAIENFLPE